MTLKLALSPSSVLFSLFSKLLVPELPVMLIKEDTKVCDKPVSVTNRARRRLFFTIHLYDPL